MSAKDKLLRYCYVHNPKNVGRVDGILESYRGKEEQMFAALEKKYGPLPSEDEAWRARITLFFKRYNPEKLASVDDIVRAYADRRSELFPALVAKYGPEIFDDTESTAAPDPATPSASRASFGNDTRARLVRFMEKYNPEKLSQIDTILGAYSGREAEMFEALVKKYGPEPLAAGDTPAKEMSSDAAAYRNRLVRYMQTYNPQNMKNVDTILQAYKGREEEMFVALVKKYGPEPPIETNVSTSNDTSNDTRSRLTRFMKQYNPEKLSTLDAILTAYRGREEEMFAALIKKYGPEPESTSQPPLSSSNASPPTRDAKQRLCAFMEKYNPEKLANVDNILKAYAGREEAMFAALVKKYGPEPIATADASPTATAAQPGSLVNRCLENLGITAEKVLDDFPENELMMSLTRTFGQVESGRGRGELDTRSRLLLFMEKYNPEKVSSIDTILKAYTGKEGELFDALVRKYGPEPNAREQEKSPMTVQQFLEKKNITHSQALLSLFPTEQKLVQYVSDKYGDFEARIRRLFVRYCPENLEAVPDLLLDHKGNEESFIRSLIERFGVEPNKDAPTKIITLLSQHSQRAEDDDAISDAEPKSEETSQKLEAPAVVKEGHLLVRDSSKAPPGDYSGDEGKAFPGEEEYWLQLRIGDRDALEASPFESRRRTYSEYHADMSDGEASPTSPSFQAAEEGSPSSKNQESAATNRLAVVGIRSKLGQDVGDMCTSCSKKVASAFDALWQPVGPGFKKVLGSSTTKDGYLEKLSGSRMGAKWQRRFFRVNDKGIHYYETNQPSEKPKGYKVLTRRSIVKGEIDPAKHPKCNDGNFFYFSVTCNETNEEFLLRTTSVDERRSWVAFLQEALERVKLTTVGQDPIPARWRARVGGVKLATTELIINAEESNTKAKTMQSRRDELSKLVEDEEYQLDVAMSRAEDLKKQRDQLQHALDELVEQVASCENEAELKSLNCVEQAAQVALRRDEYENQLVTATARVKALMDEVVELEKCVVELNYTHDDENLKLQQVFQKWRNIEQRTSTSHLGKTPVRPLTES